MDAHHVIGGRDDGEQGLQPAAQLAGATARLDAARGLAAAA